MSKFAHLQQYNPAGRQHRMTLPIGSRRADGTVVYAKLILEHAGESNPAWRNAQLTHNAKTGLAKKAVQGSSDTSTIATERDLELYPQLIVKGWEDVYDTKGHAVAFSVDECAEFLRALPPWLFDQVRLVAINPQNFLDVDMPTIAEASAVAGG